jgi:hypothetical protein
MQYRRNQETNLQRKNTNTAGALHKDSLTGQQRLQSVQSIPACKSRTSQGCRFKVVQVSRGADDAVLVEDTVLAQGAVNGTAETGGSSRGIDGAVLVLLIEECDHFIAFLELGDLGSDLDDFAGTIGTGNNGEIEGKGILSVVNSSFSLAP